MQRNSALSDVRPQGTTKPLEDAGRPTRGSGDPGGRFTGPKGKRSDATSGRNADTGASPLPEGPETNPDAA